MHGLAVFQHDIVGDVHDIVNGTDTGSAQPLPHPDGAGANFDVLHQTTSVTRAQVGFFDDDVSVVHDDRLAAALHHRVVELQRLAEGDGRFSGQTDDGQTVGTVGGDLKFHHVVIQTQQGGDVIAGLAVLVEDEDAVVDAVGEFLGLCVEVSGGQDAVGAQVQGHEIASVDVLAVGGHVLHGVAHVDGALIGLIGSGLDGVHLTSHDLAENLQAGGQLFRQGGLFALEHVIVAQDSGSLDDAVGEIALVQCQLGQGAQHPVGGHTAELALGDLHAAGQQALVLGHGHQVAHVDVPSAGADLDGLVLAHVHLGDPHVVAVGMVFHGQDFAHDDIFKLCGVIFKGLHLGTGEGHCLGKRFVMDGADGYIYKLGQPFTG